MGQPARSLYPDYKRIWTFGMSYSGQDGQFRIGLVRYRGHTKKWLLRDIGYPLNDIERLLNEDITCDLLLGRIHSQEHVDLFARFGKPIIDLADSARHPLIAPSHSLDYVAGGALAANYLGELGHRNFAFISYQKGTGHADDRVWDGFSREALPKAASLHLIRRLEDRQIQMKPLALEQPLPSVSAWLRKMERPMAVLISNDYIAQEICQFASFSGVSIPEDLALVGMQNDPIICETCLPSLTCVHFPAEYWGYRVAEHIDAFFQGQQDHELELIPPSGIAARNSTALEVIEDPLVARGLALMRHHATSRLTLKEILSELPLTLRAFQMRFKQVTGCSPIEKLFRMRVDIARQKLVSSNHTVDRIAEECGFRHAESMAQYFKKWTGLTPTQYRRQNQVRIQRS